MKLKIGDSIRLIHRDYHHKAKNYDGTVNKIYKNYILLDLENYKVCVNVADIIKPEQNLLQIRDNKEFTKVTKEMLPNNMVKIEHLESSTAFRKEKKHYE